MHGSAAEFSPTLTQPIRARRTFDMPRIRSRRSACASAPQSTIRPARMRNHGRTIVRPPKNSGSTARTMPSADSGRIAAVSLPAGSVVSTKPRRTSAAPTIPSSSAGGIRFRANRKSVPSRDVTRTFRPASFRASARPFRWISFKSTANAAW